MSDSKERKRYPRKLTVSLARGPYLRRGVLDRDKAELFLELFILACIVACVLVGSLTFFQGCLLLTLETMRTDLKRKDFKNYFVINNEVNSENNNL